MRARASGSSKLSLNVSGGKNANGGRLSHARQVNPPVSTGDELAAS